MTIEIIYAYLQNHPLFAGVTESKILTVASALKVRTIFCGEPISMGDGDYSKIYLLLKGKIKIATFNEDGNELIKEIITSPGIFGNLSMNGNVSKDEYADALTHNTLLGVFNVTDFRRLLQENPEMAISYVSIVSGKLQRLEHRHSNLVFCSARSRLIHFIKEWAQADGDKEGDNIVLKNYLTHTDIGNIIATSRQHVNILLNEFRDAGMLLYNRKVIKLNNHGYWSQKVTVNREMAL